MTRARLEYLGSSQIVSALLALENSYADPPAEADRAAVEGLRGGSVVLMVAAFENYLKESVAEALEEINNAKPSCDFAKLPLELQAQVVYAGLQSAMHARPWDPVRERIHRLPLVLKAADHVTRGTIMSREIAETGGNPDSKQVKNIYKNVGISSILTQIKRGFDGAWGTPTAQTFIENNLDTIVQRRHIVAHTASALATSRVDLQTWQRFLDCVVDQLDAALERHIARLIKRAQV